MSKQSIDTVSYFSIGEDILPAAGADPSATASQQVQITQLRGEIPGQLEGLDEEEIPPRILWEE